MRASRVAFLVVRGHRELTTAEHERLAAYARQARIQLVEPMQPPRTRSALAALRAACNAVRVTVNRCAVVAMSKMEAEGWLRRARVDFVVRRFRSVGAFAGTRQGAARGSAVIVVVKPGAMESASWRDAIASMTTKRAKNLAAGLPSDHWKPMLERYLSVFRASEPAAPPPGAEPTPTAPTPTTPGGLRLTANGMNFLTVHWEPSTPAGAALLGYDLYLNGTLAFRSQWEEATFTGLTCGTSYLVEIEAVDAAGNRSQRASGSFVTMWGCLKPTPPAADTPPAPAPEPTAPAPSPPADPSSPQDTTAPSAPGGLAQAGASETTARLTWSASTDDVGVTGYGVYVGTVRVSTTTGTQHDFTGLTCGTDLSVAVDATDAAGNRSAPATFVLSTSACSGGDDTTAPTDPGALASTGSTESTVSLAWSGSTDDVGVAGYGVYRDGAAIGSASGTSFTASALECGESYAFAVDAFDAAGNRSGKATATLSTAACPPPPPPPGDTTAPSAPTGLSQQSSTQTSVRISWSPATDDVGVTGYGIYAGSGLVGTSNDTEHEFTGLTCGSTYSVAVDAVDAAGNRSSATALTVSTASCPGDTAAPSVPGGLSATGTTTTSVAFSWPASSDNVGVVGYGVYRDGSSIGSTAATSFTAGGLACGRSYQFAVDAVDAAGNRSAKSTATIATSPCPDSTAPTAPTGLAQASSTQTSARLTWSASSDNVGVVGYGIYVGSVLVATATSTQHDFTGLTCGSSLGVAVDAVDAAGNRSAATAFTVSTAACSDTTAPSVPGGLAATAATATSVSFSWPASSDNVGVVGYGVYRDGSSIGSTAATSFTAGGLACGRSYQFAVDAVDAAGNRSAKATATLATAACPDTTAPTTPTALRQTAASATGVSLSWSPSTDAVGVTGYGVYRNGTLLGSTADTSYATTGLACGVSYTFEVDAVDGAGNRSGKASVLATTSACVDTTPPTQPAGLAQSGSTTTSIAISWTASSDNVGVAGYRVLVNAAVVGSPTSTSFTVTGLACGTAYAIAVDAADAAGNRSTQVTATMATAPCPPPPPPPGDTDPPTAPGNLAQGALAATSIAVTWSASSDNVGVTGYALFRNGTQVATVAAGTTGYTFAGLTCGTSYVLGVEAFDAAGNRSSRSTLTRTTGACVDTQAPTVPQGRQITASTQTGITMVWLASNDNVGVTGYRVYLNGTLASTVTSLTYSFTGLTCGTTYTLAVSAVDAAGNESDRTLAQGPATTAACPGDTQPPAAPGSLTTTSVTQTSVSLFWSAAIDNVAVIGYGVYNGTSRITTVTATSYTVAGLVCGTSYALAVDAADAAGNRSTKTTLSVTTSACTPSSSVLSVSLTGSDANSCSLGSPCRSLDRAYRVATPGQVVEVAGGSYGDQSIGSDAAKTSASDVVFRPVSGASVSFGQLVVAGAKHLTLRGFKSTIWRVQSGADDVTLDQVDTGAFTIGSASNVSVLGGDVGPWDSNSLAEDSQVGASGTGTAQGLLFDGVSFHDYTNNADPSAHTECLQFMEGIDVTIRNSRFQNCGVADVVYIRGDFGPVRNFLIENNFFGYTATFSLRLSGQTAPSPPCENVLVRNNSALERMWSDCTAIGSQGVRFVGNIQPTQDNYHCSTSTQVGTVWEYNVYESGIKCGATDRVGAVSYKDRNALDLHLMAGSTGIDQGPPSNYAAKDIDGQSRPIGSAADAGADETDAAAAPPTPPPSSGALAVATGGVDTNPCTAAQPCKTFGRAYRAAAAGQVIEVAGGTYATQTIAADSTKTAASDVVLRPAAGATVRVSELNVSGSHLTVDGLTIDWWTVSGSDVTMRAIDGQSFMVTGADVTVDGGDYGPYEPPCASGSSSPNHDNPTVDSRSGGVVIRGAVFHDMTNRNCSAAHMDCLQVASVDGMAIEGNTFRGCFSNGLILTGDFGVMNNITVQNNWFGPTLVDNPALNWNPTKDCPGAVVRYNTFVGSGVRFECSQNRSAQMYGNIVGGLGSFECGSWKAVQHHNIADSGQAVAACGPGSFVAPDGQIDMVNRAAGNYHLTATSEAVNRGDGANRPSTDIDGDARPRGAAPDAGADEAA